MSNPVAPVVVGWLRTTDASDVVVIANRAYVGTANGVVVIDVSNPGSLVELGGFFGGIDGLDVVGTIVFAATSFDLQIIDFGSEYAAASPAGVPAMGFAAWPVLAIALGFVGAVTLARERREAIPG